MLLSKATFKWGQWMWALHSKLEADKCGFTGTDFKQISWQVLHKSPELVTLIERSKYNIFIKHYNVRTSFYEMQGWIIRSDSIIWRQSQVDAVLDMFWHKCLCLPSVSGHIEPICHDLGGGCLAFVVLEHMAFCFDSSPCAPLSSRSCSAHLVILFANSPFPPALYSILIISSF